MRQLLIHLVLAYLRWWARLALSLHNPTIIGIAGSVGKSSTRHALYAILQEYYPTKSLYGNSETGIPLGVLGITAHGYSPSEWIRMLLLLPFGLFYLRGTKYLIVEMGIDDPFPPKNMSYLLTILQPDIAISLNVSATHTEQFEKALTQEEKSLPEKEKLEHVLQKIADEDTQIITKSQCRIGIYNADNPFISHSLASFPKTKKTHLYSFGKAQGNDISYQETILSLQGTTFHYLLPQSSHPHISIELKGYVLPQAYQENIAAAIVAAFHAELSVEQIITALEKNFSLPKSRASILSGIKESIVIDSSYNASRVAVSAFLSLCQNLKSQTKRPVVFLFGDMRELGEEAASEHRSLLPEIEKIVDYLYCIGPLTKQYIMPQMEHSNELKEVRWFEKATDAAKYMAIHMPEQAIVLVKGSQNTLFLEEGVKLLLKNSADVEKLCRQEPFWMEKKKAYI